MLQSLRRLNRLPVIFSLVVLGALVAPSLASATHPNTGLEPSLDGYIVPVFRQCGTPANPTNAQHSPPLAVGACVPAKLQSGSPTVAATGPDTNKPIWTFSIRYTGPGQGSPCGDGNPGPTVCLNGQMDSVVTYSSGDPPYVGGVPYAGQLAAVARIRFTDHYNCQPAPCGGGTLEGTGTDLDFGPVPFGCAVGGDNKSHCTLNLDANAVVPGSVVTGIKTSLQIFRVRIIKPANPAAQQIVGQQGIAWP